MTGVNRSCGCPAKAANTECRSCARCSRPTARKPHDAYSVSEWWLEPKSDGPGPHSHEANDEIFRIVEGTMSVLVGEHWIDAPAGSTIVIPAGTTHDFANRTDAPAALFNVFIPGGFETNMPEIVKWYEENG